MNFAFSATQLPELEQLITTLFATNKCACHIINPAKTRILLWKEEKDGKIIYYLRIGIQKFISQEQIDRNGEIYWRFVNYNDNPEIKKEETKVAVGQKSAASKESDNSNELDPITKFQRRQAQTQQLNKTHDQRNDLTEQSPITSSSQ